MPLPPKGSIAALGLSCFPPEVNAQDAMKLAGAFADVATVAGKAFIDRVQMAPGVVCAVPPPPAPAVGSVAGMGTLVGAPPNEMEVKLKAQEVVKGTGMSTADQTRFVDTLAELVPKGFARLMALASVPPGTPVAGGVTAGPARILMHPGAVKAELEGLARAMIPPKMPTVPQAHRPPTMPVLGAHRKPVLTPPPGPPRLALPEGFPAIAVKLLEMTFQQMETMVMVAPGIPVAGGVTAAAGRLM